MYGLPANFDPHTLLGEELQQVCVGQSDLILNFHPPLSILVISSVAYTPTDGRRDGFKSLIDAGHFLVTLLGEAITSASVLGGGTLQLQFGDHGTLEIIDDSDQYESYVIRRGEQEIVV